ncbi:amidase family protein [Mesorhizobium opportunistum]|uniref:amidase family protein n=1 Tax=Mesorhizobium opportunistum TaxID=593909 RepID=UPI0033397E0F
MEPFNLKQYEYGRTERIDPPELHETLRKMRFQVGEAIQEFDILLTPTMPHVAPPHCDSYCTTNATLSVEEFKEADAALCQYTGIFNVAGQAPVSLPLAQSLGRLLIGVQMVGRFGDEATLVRVARDLEEALPWSARR